MSQEIKKENLKYEIGIDAIPQTGYFLQSSVGEFTDAKGKNVNYANMQILQISKKTKKPKVVKLKYLNGKEPELVNEIRPLDRIRFLVDYATLGDDPIVLDITEIISHSDLVEFK